MTLSGDEWRNVLDAPTPQDMLKFKATGATLLMQIDRYNDPIEVIIVDTARGGEYYKTNVVGFGFGAWHATSDARIVEIRTPVPTEPPAPPVATLTAEQWMRLLSVKKRGKVTEFLRRQYRRLWRKE